MRFEFPSIVAIVAVVATLAEASTVVAVDLAGLTRTSDSVIRGKVRSTEARWTKDGARIITDTVIDVSEVWKGPSKTVVVAMQPGGEIGEIGQRVEGVAMFAPGEEIVVFLEARGEKFTVAGLSLGKFRLEKSPDGKAVVAKRDASADAMVVDPTTGERKVSKEVVLTVEQLKTQVKAAVGTAPNDKPKPGPVTGDKAAQ